MVSKEFKGNPVLMEDPLTNAMYQLDTLQWRGPSGAAFMVTPLPGIGPSDIDTKTRSIWRYAAALPYPVRNVVTMGEGCTPLVERMLEGGKALLKLEWLSPTGSFKDRGASVMISVLRDQGIDRVLEDSSGNGGASIAAYAVAAGMQAKILVPASTQPSKTVQMRAYGAEVQLVPGSRQDTSNEAIRQAENIYYASHNWQPFFLQGTKTLAYELWEDLGFVAPDNIIIPTGAGSNVLGCDIGFSELKRHGEIGQLPRLFAVQPANCAPIHAAFAAGADDFVEIEVRPTIAEGTAIERPPRLREVLAAIRRSGGQTVAVSEEEIVAAVFELAKLGLFVEPTCASTAAAFARLLANGTIRPDEITVLILTGTGLKAIQRWANLVGVPSNLSSNI